MTLSKAAQLQALYAQVPHLNCQRLCQDCCGPIATFREERRIIVKHGGRGPSADPQTLTCMLLQNGQCTVYAVRPLICRLWGVVESMPCPHGCVPERYLTKEEGFALLREARRIGGSDDKRWREQLERTYAALHQRRMEVPA